MIEQEEEEEDALELLGGSMYEKIVRVGIRHWFRYGIWALNSSKDNFLKKGLRMRVQDKMCIFGVEVERITESYVLLLLFCIT